MADEDHNITDEDVTNLIRSIGTSAQKSVRESVLKQVRSQDARTKLLRELFERKDQDEQERDR